jgi:hypothetical protein
MVKVSLTASYQQAHKLLELSEREPYGFVYGRRLDLKRDQAGWLLRGVDLFEIRLVPGVPTSFLYGVELIALLTV